MTENELWDRELVDLLERELGPDWRESSRQDVLEMLARIGARRAQLEAELEVED